MRVVRRGLAALLVALCFAPVAACASPPASVRDRVLTIVRAKLSDATIVVTDPHGFSIKLKGRDETQISVQRIDDFCAVNPKAECDDQVTTFVTSVVELSTMDTAVSPARLRVVLRNRLDTDGYLATIKEAGKQPLVRPLFDGVSAVLAADFPKGTRMVNAEDLAALKLDRDAAFELGIKQVLADLPPVPELAQVDGQLIAVQGFDYGASIMLQPERWAKLAEASSGRLFVGIPGDNSVLVGTTKPGEDLARLKAFMAEQYRLAPRGISPDVYRWSPAGWRPLP